MTKRLLLSFLLIAVAFSSGCHFFRKSHKQKESGAIAAGVETEFKQRWMAHRISELAAQGITGPAAEEQADREYKAKYTFADPKK